MSLADYNVVNFLGEDITPYLTTAGVRLLQPSPSSGELYISHVKWGQWTMLSIDGVRTADDLKARIGAWLDGVIKERSAA